jgi:hypothetical protein
LQLLPAHINHIGPRATARDYLACTFVIGPCRTPYISWPLIVLVVADLVRAGIVKRKNCSRSPHPSRRATFSGRVPNSLSIPEGPPALSDFLLHAATPYPLPHPSTVGVLAGGGAREADQQQSPIDETSNIQRSNLTGFCSMDDVCSTMHDHPSTMHDGRSTQLREETY